MEWFTFGIAVLGFAMSSLSWIRDLWLRRNRIDLTVIDYTQVGIVTQFYLLLRNGSTLPSSIAKISVMQDGSWHDCILEPKLIKKSQSYTAITPCFPISIAPLSYSAFYVEFLPGKNTLLGRGTEVFFQIHTSRGILRKSKFLGDKANYLRNR